ncbi:MAG TPA: hypothetical protein PK993_03910 [Clostridia bacterium]|nr:hypothetical protein [Clostridia bacterium]
MAKIKLIKKRRKIRKNLVIPRKQKQKINKMLTATIRAVNRNNIYKANKMLNYAKSITLLKKRRSA